MVYAFIKYYDYGTDLKKSCEYLLQNLIETKEEIQITFHRVLMYIVCYI
jgi:hypothetical protein